MVAFGLAVTPTTGCLIDNPRYVPELGDESGTDTAGTTGPGVGTSSMTSVTSLTSAGSTASTTDAPPTTGTNTSTTSITTTGPVSTADSGQGATGDPFDCSAFDPESCPIGQGCKPIPNVDDADATACLPVVRTPPLVWQPCTLAPDGGGPDDCDAGFVCYGAQDPDLGICTPLCQGDANVTICEYSGTRCELFGDGLFGLCLAECDPFEDSCIDGDSCYAVPQEDGGPFTLLCASDESGALGAAGDPCGAANSCDPGLACIPAEQLPGCLDGSCCTPLCSTALGGLCQVGLDCVSLWDPDVGPPPPNLQDVGVCVALF